MGSDIYDRLPVPDSTQDQRLRAVRAVASRAVDAEDCEQLLSILGLEPVEGKR